METTQQSQGSRSIWKAKLSKETNPQDETFQSATDYSPAPQMLGENGERPGFPTNAPRFAPWESDMHKDGSQKIDGYDGCLAPVESQFTWNHLSFKANSFLSALSASLSACARENLAEIQKNRVCNCHTIPYNTNSTIQIQHNTTECNIL